MKLGRAFLTVGSLTAASRVLGFVRDILFAAYMGTGPVAEAFIVAFRIPNFFRRLFAEGAFSTAFVPIFSGILATQGREIAFRYAEMAMAVLITTLASLVLFMELFMPEVMFVIAPGITDDPERLALTVTLARITFPYLLFVSMVALLGGVLNSIDRFGAMAASPIILNLMMIGAMLALPAYTPTIGHAVSWGVFAAGIAQWLALLAVCHRDGFTPKLTWPSFSPEIIKLFRKMIPGILGAGVYQANVLMDIFLASLLPMGSISYLYYADRVSQLPIGIIGVGIGTALLPILTRETKLNNNHDAQKSRSQAVLLSLFLALPATAGLFMLANPIVITLFERGVFTPEASTLTTFALQAYVLGIPAIVLSKVLSAQFFAREDTRTPFMIALATLALNLAGNLIFMQTLYHVGLALSTSLSAWAQVIMLDYFLKEDGMTTLPKGTKIKILSLLAATFAMCGLLWLGTGPFHDDLHQTLHSKYLILFVQIATGGTLYFFVAYLLGVWRFNHLNHMR